MKRTVLVRSLLVPVIIFGLVGFSQAQEVNDAIEAYNNAWKLSSSDPTTAIVSAKECLDFCSQLGAEGTDVKIKAENLLPGLYFNVGNLLIKGKKFDQAIPAFQEALKVAEKYKNEEYVVKSKSMLPKLYNSIGGTYYKEEQFDKAVEALNQAIVYDPDYAKAYYTMGLVYKKLDDQEKFESTMDKGLIAADNSKDSKTKDQIKKAANTFFLASGTKSLADGKAAEAAPLLNKALKYDPAGIDTYFYLARSYNELKQYDAAIEAANKALEIEEPSDDKRAKHFYNLGLAYKGKGDKEAACEAFNKALFGQFKENAQYEIEYGVKCNE